MKTGNIEKLILKYLTHSITKKEWDELNLWVEQSTDHKRFYELLKINYAIDDIMSEFNTEGTKDSVLKKIRKDKKVSYVSKIRYALKYAAVVLVLFGIGYFYQEALLREDNGETVLPIQDAVTLELENGSLEVLSNGETSQIVDADGKIIGTQNGSRLRYNKTESTQMELVYNQLTVPYGKRFELELSDGTIAYLNAGSSLKYPVNFIKGQERRVYLEGEAFLEVAKNVSRPFFVTTSDNLNIQVLGTKFNVSNYPEDHDTEVVLVEGSVGLGVDNRTNDIVLKPGFKGTFDKQEKNFTAKPVITSTYTSWMKGVLIFRNTTFENILKRLERHYNVTIVDKNQKFAKKKFNANFGNESLEKVLDYFQNTYGIDYEIDNDKITIK